jgi:hypothetical protein
MPIGDMQRVTQLRSGDSASVWAVHQRGTRRHRGSSLFTDDRETRGFMYAIVTNVRVENPDKARLLLPKAREALVSRAPGIVCGYWLEPIDGIGTSVLVFETKEDAEAAAKYPVPPMPGVTQLDLTVREVFAHV